jgi:hypothetical protein
MTNIQSPVTIVVKILKIDTQSTGTTVDNTSWEVDMGSASPLGGLPYLLFLHAGLKS